MNTGHSYKTMTITLNGNGTITGYTPTVTTSMLPTGSVIQVKQGANSSEISQNSSTDFEIVTVQITPTSSSNKIFIFGSVMGIQNGNGSNNTRFLCRLNSDVGGNLHNADGNHWLHSTTTVMRYGGFSINHVDSPSTTNTITYKIIGYWADPNSQNCYINKDSNAGSTTITVMEVAA